MVGFDCVGGCFTCLHIAVFVFCGYLLGVVLVWLIYCLRGVVVFINVVGCTC